MFRNMRTAVVLSAIVASVLLLFARTQAQGTGTGRLDAERVDATAGAQAASQVECSPVEQQLERDKDAMRRQQQSIGKNLEELEEWEKTNSEAQHDAVMAGVKVIAGQMAEALERVSKATRTFDQFLKNRKVPLYMLSNGSARPVVEKAFQAYQEGSAAARAAATIKGGLLALDVWSLFKSTIGTVAHSYAGSEAALRETVSNPEMRALLQADEAGRVVLADLENSLFTMAAQSTQLAKLIGPQTEFASFIVDYGYNATKWMTSRNRILQNADLSDQQLKAVNALKTQIERTVTKLQDCRAKAKAQQPQPETPEPPQPPAPTPPVKSGMGLGTQIALAGAAVAGVVGGAVVYQEYKNQQALTGGTTTGGGTTPTSSTAVSYRAQATRTCTPGIFTDAPGVPASCSVAIGGSGACGTPTDFMVSVRNGTLSDVCGWLSTASVSGGRYSGIYQGAGSGVPVSGTFNTSGTSSLAGDGPYECCHSTAVNHVRITLTRQ